MSNPKLTTLRQAKEHLRKNFEEGVNCPCCGQFVRLYKRPINSTMARALVWIAGESQKSKGGWVDVPAKAPKWLTKTNQHTTLRWWGLLERMPNEESYKKHSGVWRPTKKGIAFALGETKVPQYILHYNNKVIGQSDETVDISEAFGVKFDYKEVMKQAGLGDSLAVKAEWWFLA